MQSNESPGDEGLHQTRVSTKDQSFRQREDYTAVTLDSLLVEVLACPEDKGPLLYFADEHRLYNPRLRRSYEVRDGIPVMLVDESTVVDDAEHHRLMALAESGAARSTGSGTGSTGSGTGS